MACAKRLLASRRNQKGRSPTDSWAALIPGKRMIEFS